MNYLYATKDKNLRAFEAKRWLGTDKDKEWSVRTGTPASYSK